MTEETLSDKIEKNHFSQYDEVIPAIDVKEFIKILKENVPMWCNMKEFQVIAQIDKLAGDALISNHSQDETRIAETVLSNPCAWVSAPDTHILIGS